MLAQMRNVLATILFVAAALLCHSSVSAQSLQQGSFVADANTGCKVWNPHPQANELVIWSGNCAGGYAQGAGNLQWVHGGNLTRKTKVNGTQVSSPAGDASLVLGSL